MATSREERGAQARAIGRIVARAWTDDAFKQQLIANPTEVLKAQGVAIPEGVDVRVVENTESTIYLILPARPGGEISDEQLTEVAGGAAELPATISMLTWLSGV